MTGPSLAEGTGQAGFRSDVEEENFSTKQALENELLLKGSFPSVIHGREEVVQH